MYRGENIAKYPPPPFYPRAPIREVRFQLMSFESKYRDGEREKVTGN
jgi:hypothetical protein